MSALADLPDTDRRQRIEQIFPSLNGFDDIVAAIPHAHIRRAVADAMSYYIGVSLSDHISTDASFKMLLVSVGSAINCQGDFRSTLSQVSNIIDEAILLAAKEGRTAPSQTRADSGSSEAAVSPAGSSGRSLNSVHARAASAEPSGTQTSPSLSERDALKLFADVKPFESQDISLRSLLLPGPGPKSRGVFLNQWVSGKPWSETVMAMSFDNLNSGAIEELSELEAEIFSAPELVFEAKHMRLSLQEDDAAVLAWVNEMLMSTPSGGDEQPYACDLWARAVEKAIIALSPSHAGVIAFHGGRLSLGSRVPDLLAAAFALEAHFLADCDPDIESHLPVYDVRGTASPDGRMYPGIAFNHAAYYHFVTGSSMSTALREGLMQMRFAQALRGVDEKMTVHVSQNFDRFFLEDFRRPLSGYKNSPAFEESLEF